MEIELISLRGSEKQADKLIEFSCVRMYSSIGFGLYDITLRVPEETKGLKRFKTLKGLIKRIEEMEL